MSRDIPDGRWREAGVLFNELVQLDESSRSGRLAQLGDTDPELRALVEALLAADASAEAALPVPGFGLGGVSDADAADTLGLAGQTIGRFRVVEQIAWGGMGVVYRAEDEQLHRSVALKFPLLDRGVTESARALTLREARAAGALDHPNLCPIYDVGESADGPFFVMPLYRGETLKERIARAAPLEISEALTILEQLAAGLACAHGAGIIHCDIKPGNIMLLPDGTVKLLDFGLARAVAAAAPVAAPLIGTVAYMAPEQLRHEPVDARADLWALGVILYEMLCGSRPFAGDSARKIAGAVLDSEPRPLGSRGVMVPAAVQELVNQLLAKDARARIQTAAELSGVIAAARRALERPSSRRSALRRMTIGAGVLAGIGLLAILLLHRAPVTLISSGKLSPGDTIVLADFDVSGPALDASNGPALNEILRREFRDWRAVSLTSADRLGSALKRMRLPPRTAVSPGLAREIALRDGKRAVLSGSVSPLGSGFVITLRLIEAEKGAELAASTTTALTVRDLLAALAQAARELRGAIGESPGDASSAPLPKPRPLTTISLDAARLMWGRPGPRSDAEKITDLLAATRLDTAFAYAWMDIGNVLSWTTYRTVLGDSAFKMAYGFRDNLTLMERGQVSGLYWHNVQRDRRTAIAELELALAPDTTIDGVVPLNIQQLLVETRQFARAETFGRRIERWNTVGMAATGDLVRSQVAQGLYAAAESTIMRRRARLGASDLGSVAVERMIALSRLDFDSAEVILGKMRESKVESAALYRLRGRLAEAHRLEARVDSERAAVALAAGARFDSTTRIALTLAREALWLRDDTAAAIARLNERWRLPSPIHDIQDRIEGIQAAALYAAAGQAPKARKLLALFDAGADTIAKRASYEYREAALAEIASAERNFADAMHHFRASDRAADGLPASPCGVCVLPHLARVAARAGWSDSARVFWEAYLHTPAIERLSTDQWFLSSAYTGLSNLARKGGDSALAARYRDARAKLRSPTPRRAG